MTDNDIKKALDEIVKLSSGIVIDWGINRTDAEAIYKTAKGALDLINRLEKENNALFLELEGVMWSVDKWLDGDELKQDKVNRAITMREKALQITERQEAEIERLKAEIEEVNEADRETELQALKESKENAKMFCEAINHAKSEAIKEFIKRFEKNIKDVKFTIGQTWEIQCAIKQTLKDLTESPTKIEHSSLCETETYEVKE